MTFYILPGICAIFYFYNCGYEGKKVNLKNLYSFIIQIINIKNEAIKQTSQTLAGKYFVIVVLIINIVLFLISVDKLMIIIMNFSAGMVSYLSYKSGKKHRIKSGLNANKIQNLPESLKIKHYSSIKLPKFKLIAIWFLTTIIIMSILYLNGSWTPH